MSKPVFLPSQEPEIIAKINAALDARFRQFEAVLSQPRTLGNKIEAGKIVHELVDDVFGIVRAYIAYGEIRCQKGCSYCCDIRVQASPIEAFQIAEFIRGVDEAKAKVWVEKLEEHSAYAKDRREQGFQKTCPFLGEDGVCGIYEVRPYTCRIYHSMDEKRCRLERKNFRIELVHRLNEIISNNIALMLIQDHLSPLPTELAQSVLLALRDPSCGDAWLAGKKPFPMSPEHREELGLGN